MRRISARKRSSPTTHASSASMMSGVVLTITQKAGEEGQLFGSVTAQDIAEALAAQNYTIERRKIQLEHPIKQVGEYKVPVRLHKDVTIEIPVNVVALAE